MLLYECVQSVFDKHRLLGFDHTAYKPEEKYHSHDVGGDDYDAIMVDDVCVHAISTLSDNMAQNSAVQCYY